MTISQTTSNCAFEAVIQKTTLKRAQEMFVFGKDFELIAESNSLTKRYLVRAKMSGSKAEELELTKDQLERFSLEKEIAIVEETV
ncbi:hypothetical protein ACP6H1_27365 [Vibrio harveyi]|uniref:hypothetical protein n=1 Tax=Vibrio harveyi TaxID=669 RepID=UPI003CEBBB6B